MKECFLVKGRKLSQNYQKHLDQAQSNRIIFEHPWDGKLDHVDWLMITVFYCAVQVVGAKLKKAQVLGDSINNHGVRKQKIKKLPSSN